MSQASEGARHGPVRTLALLAAVAVAYFGAARLGLALASIHGTVSPVWPATGLAIGALVLGGIRLWPAVLVGAFFANLPGPIAWTTALAISFGNAGEAIVGAWLIDNTRTSWVRSSLAREGIGCGVAAMIAPLVSVAVGVGALWLSDAVPSAMVDSVAWTWWVGDVLGALTVTPLMLAIAGRSGIPRMSLPRIAMIAALAGGAGAWLFLRSTSGELLFAVFPVLIIATWLSGAVGVRLAALLLCAAGVFAGFLGYGPFVGGSLNDNLLFLQLFLASVAVAALVLPVFSELGGLHVAGAVLFLGWSVSGGLFGYMQRERLEADRARVDSMASAAERAIRQRMDAYLEELRAGAALFAASEHVSRAEWRVFVGAMAIEARMPGIRALGVARRVRNDELEAFVQSQRRDDTPEFSVRTLAKGRNAPGGERMVVTHIEPMASNRQDLGLDLGSEANRRAAAEEARDSGESRASAKVIIEYDDGGGAGFLVFHPIYRHEAGVLTEQDRRAALEGWVFAPFEASRFLGQIFMPPELELSLFDGRSVEPEALLFGSGRPASTSGGFEKIVAMEMAGNLYTMAWNRSALFQAASPAAAVLTATSLALVTLLLAGLVMSLQSTGKDAREIAATRTAELTVAQSSLAEINRLQRAVLDGTVYSIIATELDGTIRIFNRGAERLLGYRREEMIGRETPAIIHVPEEVVARAAELTAELGRRVEPGFETFVARASLGEVEQREWTYLRKNGSRVSVLLSVSALRDDSGTITGYLGIAHDLTERRALEQTLRFEQSRLRLANEAAGIAVWEWDIETGIVRWDAAMFALYGMAPTALGRVPHEEWGAALHPDDRAAQGAILHETVQTVGRSQREFRIIRISDGEIRYVNASELAIAGPDGRTARLVGVNRDITERRRAMEQLRQSQARLASIFGAVREGLVLQNADGRILECNTAASRILGLSREQMEGRSSLDAAWRAVHEDGSAYPGSEHPAMVTLRTGEALLEAIMGVHKPDGTLTWISISTAPIRDPSGAVQAVVCSFSDVSAQRHIARDLAQARDDALEASRLKSEFLATMSHEIRTPMNGIIGTIELLLGSPLDATQHEMARLIEGSAENLLEIINDILDFSRIEAGKFRLNLEPFQVLPLVEETAGLLAARAHRKGLELILDVEPALAAEVLVGDASRLRQILLNIIGNAVKFTERGEVIVTARINPLADGRGRLRIAVRDTGIGIGPEFRDRLFQAFSQVDSSSTRRYGGTGLGLAISRQLIELMGGELDFTSEPGQGSEFWFEAVLVRQPAAAAVAANGDLDVLVVDDNATAGATLVRQLRALGAAADSVDSASAALAWLERLVPAATRRRVVLIDRQMPAADGIRLVRTIREQTELRETALVLLCPTGGADIGHELDGMRVSAVIGKPVRIAQLQVALSRARKGSDVAADAGGKPAPRSQIASGATIGRDLRILVAEDNPANQLVARMVLESMGYSVDVADNGRVALERLAEVRYDVVFMDCQMPEFDGYEVTRRVRRGLVPGADARQLIIALTAFAMEADREKCRAAGMDDYVSKPVRARDVRAVLARCGLAQAEKSAAAALLEEIAPAHEFGHEPQTDEAFMDSLRSLPGRSGPSLLDEVVEVYSREAATRTEELAALLAAGDLDALARSAHTLAGSSANAGAPRARAAFAAIENAVRAGAANELAGRIATARQVWQELRAEFIRRGLLSP